MDYEEFKSIVMELGHTELEARWLWSAKPREQKPTVAGVAYASKMMLPSIIIMRESPDYEEIIKQQIVEANAINN